LAKLGRKQELTRRKGRTSSSCQGGGKKTRQREEEDALNHRYREREPVFVKGKYWLFLARNKKESALLTKRRGQEKKKENTPQNKWYFGKKSLVFLCRGRALPSSEERGKVLLFGRAKKRDMGDGSYGDKRETSTLRGKRASLRKDLFIFLYRERSSSLF